MQPVQCYSYKEYGHIAANCAKKSCNYCKKLGHIIKDCPTRPQNCQANVNQVVVGNQAIVGPVVVDKSALTPEMVQQMIISAFSALRLQGKGDLPSSFWLVDSGASNHMTSSFDTLSNVRTYHGATNIQIANGTRLPIHAKNVFVSPELLLVSFQ